MPEDAALVEAMFTAWCGDPPGPEFMEDLWDNMTRVLSFMRQHDAAYGLRNATLHFRCPEGAEALHAALGIAGDSEACGKLDAAFKAVARAERLKGNPGWRDLEALHDAPTLATLTASLAEAEARAGRAEAAVERLREALRYYSLREHWMTLTEDAGPVVVWVARTHLDTSPDGFSTAQAALQETPDGR